MAEFGTLTPVEIHQKSSETVFRIGRIAERYSEKIQLHSNWHLKKICTHPENNFPPFHIYRRRWIRGKNEKLEAFFNSTYYDIPDGGLSEKANRTIESTIKFLLNGDHGLKKLYEIQEYLKKNASDKADVNRIIKNWLNEQKLTEYKYGDKANPEDWYYLLKIFSQFPQDGGIPKHITELEKQNKQGNGAYIVRTLNILELNSLPNLNISYIDISKNANSIINEIEQSSKLEIHQSALIEPESGEKLSNSLTDFYSYLLSLFQQHGETKSWTDYVWLCIPVYDFNNIKGVAGSLQGILFQILQYPESVRKESDLLDITFNYHAKNTKNLIEYIKTCVIHTYDVAKELVEVSMDEFLRQDCDSNALDYLEKYIHLLGDYKIKFDRIPSSSNQVITINLSNLLYDNITTPILNPKINEIQVFTGEDIAKQKDEKIRGLFETTLERRLRKLYSTINDRLESSKMIEDFEYLRRKTTISLTTHSLKTQLSTTVIPLKNNIKDLLDAKVSDDDLIEIFRELSEEIDELYELTSLISLIDKIDNLNEEKFCKHAANVYLFTDSPNKLDISYLVEKFNKRIRVKKQVIINSIIELEHFKIPIYSKFLGSTLMNLFFNTLFENIISYGTVIHNSVTLYIEYNDNHTWSFWNYTRDKNVTIDDKRLTGNLSLFKILIEGTNSGKLTIGSKKDNVFNVQIELYRL